MRCPRCFRRYDDDSRFCQDDGERLVELGVRSVVARSPDVLNTPTVIGLGAEVHDATGYGSRVNAAIEDWLFKSSRPDSFVGNDGQTRVMRDHAAAVPTSCPAPGQ